MIMVYALLYLVTSQLHINLMATQGDQKLYTTLMIILFLSSDVIRETTIKVVVTPRILKLFA